MQRLSTQSLAAEREASRRKDDVPETWRFTDWAMI